ncbi:hypothetical protein E2562_013412 [Oryza meyeriana var. granulata]|uniref:Uncharacterized protein n=1 Tax=Oryza meyeriana var. granulata TaxID=110450 RepID=A0A6G1E989_9ORYZ|nr:hypothetical protein E2562_013412 [Oryza meyeriana var. granulata]
MVLFAEDYFDDLTLVNSQTAVHTPQIDSSPRVPFRRAVVEQPPSSCSSTAATSTAAAAFRAYTCGEQLPVRMPPLPPKLAPIHAEHLCHLHSVSTRQ